MSDGGGESTSSPLDQKIMASSGLLHRISRITLSEENYHRRGKRAMESKKMQPDLVFSALNQSNVFFFILIADYWKYVIFVPWLSCCTSRKNEKKYKGSA